MATAFGGRYGVDAMAVPRHPATPADAPGARNPATIPGLTPDSAGVFSGSVHCTTRRL